MWQRHVHEVGQAEMVAQRSRQEAMQQALNAEVYANAVSLLGERAAEELQARDTEYSCMKYRFEYYEQRTSGMETEANEIMRRANLRIHEDAERLSGCEARMATIKSELEVAARHLQHQTPSLAYLPNTTATTTTKDFPTVS